MFTPLTRRNLLALMGAGVSAFVIAAHAAHAATGQSFTPVTSWAVNRIDPPNGGAPYCTLARRFDGNTVITFARNTSGEGTIAVDFQQPLFDPNQTYRIGLQAGQGLKREFMTRPATPNALVLRTGQDSQFFNALASSNEMGVILDATRYAFSIPDFAAGTSQLTGCIGGGAAAVPRAPVASAPASAAESTAINQLRAELDALKRENAGIVASLKQTGSAAQSSAAALPPTAENKELVSRLSELEAEKNALVDRLQGERARQQQEARNEADLQQALEDQKALRAMLENERNERAALEAALSQKTVEAEKRGELRARITALESSNAELKTLRETLETERGKRLAAEKLLQDQKLASAASLEDQERLRTRVSELESENKSLMQTASQFESARMALEDTANRATTEQARREAAEKALKDMQMSISKRESALTDLQLKLEEERRKLESATSAKQAEQARAHADEIAALNAQIESLRAQGSMNSELSQKAAAAEKELQTVKAALSAKETELAKLNGERADLMAQLEKERAEAAKSRVTAQDDSKLRDLSDKLAELETRNSALMEELQTAKEQTQAAEQATVTTASNDPAINEKISELGRKAEADRRELQALLEAEKARREKLEAIMAKGGSADDRMKEMDAQISELQKRNNELEARLRNEKMAPPELANNVEETNALRKQLAMLKNDNVMLAEKLAGIGAAGPAKEAQVVFSGDEKMAEALAETKSSLASALAERDEYRDLLQRERLDKGKATQGAGKVESGTPAANARIAALEEERAELIRQLEFERARLEQIAAGREAPPAAEGRSEKDLEARLAALEAEKDKLRKQLDVTQRDVIAAREMAFSGRAATDDDVAALLAENKKLQAELAASARGGNADTRAMETEIAALRAQNSVLSEEINKRLAAAPSRAAMDNVAAEANYKVREAKVVAKQETAGELAAAQQRFAAAEAENIRLAKELAQARMAPIVDQGGMMQQPPLSPAPQPVVAAARPQPQQDRAQPERPAAPAMFTPASIAPDVGPSGQDIAGYLKRAGIPMVSGFEKVRKVSNAQFGAFRWDTGVVFGTAEQQPMTNAQGFEQAVNAYITKTRQRCSGTFDQSFDPSQMSSTKKAFAVADVACVMPDGTGAAAAMLFFYKDGMFNVIAHEGDIGQFDQAMSTRDSLARFMEGVL